MDKKEEIKHTSSEPEIDKKIKVMVEKVGAMENALKLERIARVALADENKELKDSLEALTKQSEEKDELFKTLYIEKLKLEKELNSISSQNNAESLLVLKLNTKQKVQHDIQSRMEYYKMLYEKEKTKQTSLQKEIFKIKKEYEEFRETEKQKCQVLQGESAAKDAENTKLKVDIKFLSEANKNYLAEINALNTIIDQLYKQNDIMAVELRYSKNELDLTKSQLKETTSQLRRQDAEFSAISRKLNEIRSSLEDVQITNKIFNVTRVGRVYESNADILFTLDEAKNYVMKIKYMYTTNTFKILEIDDIFLRSENLIKIKYIPNKNLRNEKFRTVEANEIIKLYKEMKERAIAQSNDNKKGEEHKYQIAQTNLKQMLEELF